MDPLERAHWVVDALERTWDGRVLSRRDTGRSTVMCLGTEQGSLWIKCGYALPPGEEMVIARLATQWAQNLPKVLASWRGGFAMAPMGGRALDVEDGRAVWRDAATLLGAIQGSEKANVETWLELGVRDRRPQGFAAAMERLLASPVLMELDAASRRGLERGMPRAIDWFAKHFQAEASLVPQDSGCCNIQVSDGRPILHDWADVVVGHPAFSCDRLLDQAPAEWHEALIAAFAEAVGCSASEIASMRRLNVLHEALRYHDELAYVEPGSETHTRLQAASVSQLRVMVEHSSLFST